MQNTKVISRQKKTYKYHTVLSYFRTDSSLYERLAKYCKEKQIGMGTLLRQLAQKFMEGK